MSTTTTSQSINHPSPSPLHFPDLTNLAEKLQETAQTLMAFSQATQPLPDNESEQVEVEEPLKKPSEFRTYRLPWFIVDVEKEMLELTGAQDWQEMFHQTRCQLRTLATLMQHFDESEEVDGFFLNQIAENIMEPTLDMLDRLCSLIADFREQPEE